jgi:bifunctional non-homologous end joining protein LigD
VLPQFQPMPLQKRVSAFDHPDWVFELKYDGFRALAYIESGGCRLMSRNGNQFKSFPFLNLALPLECKAKSAVLDGEIVCFDKDGCSQFEDLLFRRGEPRFLAFDCLYCDGENLRYLPLSDRKHRLKGIVPHWRQRLLYCDHIDGMGETLFNLACERDLEGIVAKRRFDPYLLDGSASWFKIKNSSYSQWAGREELFDRERSTDPDGWGWESCAIACESVLA